MWVLNWIWVFWDGVVVVGGVGIEIMWGCWVVGERKRNNMLISWEGKGWGEERMWMIVNVFLRVVSLVVRNILISWRGKVLFISGVIELKGIDGKGKNMVVEFWERI